VPEAHFASFASAFVRLPAGITKADVGVTASEASPNVSEITALGCEAAITRSSAGSASSPDADRIFDLGDVAKRVQDRSQ